MNLNLDQHQQTAQALPGPAECERVVQDRQEIMAGLPIQHGQECTLVNLREQALLFMAGKHLVASAKAGTTKLCPRKYCQGRKPLHLRGG